jgi:hypothetical protein
LIFLTRNKLLNKRLRYFFSNPHLYFAAFIALNTPMNNQKSYGLAKNYSYPLLVEM